MNYLCNIQQSPEGRKDYPSFSFSPEDLEELEPKITEAINIIA